MKRVISLGLILYSLSVAGQTTIDESKPSPPAPVGAVQTGATHPAVYTIPAGTRILAKLTSPLHTTSATAGSGIYMTTEAPIVINDRVVVPVKSSLLGTIEHDRRPGRVRGRAQFRFGLHTLILPNNHTVEIAGSLQDLPGSSVNRRVDSRGTTEPVDQIDHDVHTMVRSTLTGAAGGAIFGRNSTSVAIGTGAGAVAGLAKVLFTRGDEINLPAGTAVELILERSATVAAECVP